MAKENISKLLRIAQSSVTFREANQNIFESIVEAPNAASILSCLGQFMECVRYIRHRRTTTKLKIESEADVQDILYLMLRPWITDLKYEEPSGKAANRFVIKDFFVPSSKMTIEAKFVRDRSHGKNISKELHDDIEMYRQNHSCKTVAFFVYDPGGFIPSADALEKSLNVSRVYDGIPFDVKIIIKP